MKFLGFLMSFLFSFSVFAFNYDGTWVVQTESCQNLDSQNSCATLKSIQNQKVTIEATSTIARLHVVDPNQSNIYATDAITRPEGNLSQNFSEGYWVFYKADEKEFTAVVRVISFGSSLETYVSADYDSKNDLLRMAYQYNDGVRSFTRNYLMVRQ